MKRLVLAGMVVAATASGLVPAQASPHRSAVHRADDNISTPLSGAVAVSPTSGTSTEVDAVRLLAGSTQYLVFSRQVPPPPGGTDVNSYDIYASTSSGQLSHLETQSPAEPLSAAWSVEGNIVTTVPIAQVTTVLWFDLTANTSGTGSIPAGAIYLGATTTGWAYVVNGQVFTKTTSGDVTSLGYPFGLSDTAVTSGTTGPDGLLVADDTSAVAYVPYADPTHPVVLTTVNLGSSDPTTDPAKARCVLRDVDAMCTRVLGSGTARPEGERLSLTGGSAVAVPAISGTAYGDFAIDDQATALEYDDFLRLTKPDNSGVADNTSFAGAEVVSAFGKIVVTDPAATSISELTAPGDAPTAFIAATTAPVEAGGSSLTSGRVVYLDDQVSPSTDPEPYIWSRSIRAVHGAIKLGSPSFVAAMNDDLAVDSAVGNPVVSSSTLAYQEVGTASKPPYRIQRPVDPRDIGLSHNDAIQTLSGNQIRRGSGAIVNTVANPVTEVHHGDSPSSSLWGNEYCYVTNAGQVGCLSLGSGKRTVVYQPKHAYKGTRRGETWVYGDHVGWSGPQHPHRLYVGTLGQRGRMALSVNGRDVFAFTSNGIVLSSLDQSTGMVTYYLRGYGAHAASREVLRAPYQDLGPEIDQSVMTWNDNGTVMAAPLPHVSDPPRFLGDPDAGATVAPGADNAWQAYLPYSATLTKCAVTISSGHTVLRRLACDPTNMKYGGLVVSWDGVDKAGHAVSAGNVTWSATCANNDGVARAGDGGKHPVTGTIKVVG